MTWQALSVRPKAKGGSGSVLGGRGEGGGEGDGAGADADVPAFDFFGDVKDVAPAETALSDGPGGDFDDE